MLFTPHSPLFHPTSFNVPDDDFNPPAATPTQPVLKGREVIVGVCGGIAAYKVADVVSKLVQLGAGVTVVMTNEAQKFITPLTFEALSGRPVRTTPFDLVETTRRTSA